MSASRLVEFHEHSSLSPAAGCSLLQDQKGKKREGIRVKP